MTNHFHSHMLIRIAITLTLLWALVSNPSVAGICDISGGSGIGGTGTPMLGIGGTGQIVHGSGSGIGGTGQVARGTGIGGTGARARKAGIGGTGQIARGSGIGGTGQAVEHNGLVVGTITGFGSICVNGIEIHYKSDTPLQLNGQTVNPDSSLAIGQVIAVGVSGMGKEVTANEMHILHAATGPVSTIDFIKGELEVLGQKVHFNINSASSSELNNLQSGDFVEVSGLRDHSGNIVASRIDTIENQQRASLRGPVTSISNNSFTIQGIKVDVKPSGLSIGENVHISGQLDNNRFRADSININQQKIPPIDMGGLISIEGYLDSNSVTSVEVAGRVVAIPSELQSEVRQISAHERIIVTGHLIEDNIIQMEQILIDISTEIREDPMPSLEHDSHKDDEHDERREKESTVEHFDVDKNHQDLEQAESKDRDKQEFEVPEISEFEDHETPEHEASEVPEFEVPETSEHEVPEFEAPEAPEHETPEVPEFEVPEVPEYEAPEVPEFEVPEIPEYETPEVPEFEVPEIPEYEAPEVPEFEVPEIPEYEAPEVPEFEVPEIPEYEAPEMPEYEAPELPEYEAPEVPEFEVPEFEDPEH